MNNAASLTIDVTIPVLNEERRLERGITELLHHIHATGMEGWTVTIADNGSDDRTQPLALQLCESNAAVRYVRIAQRGVGLALRASWTDNSADVVGYMDVDLATNLRHLNEVERAFRIEDALVVNGSRLLPNSRVVGRKLLREITSRGLNILMRGVLGVAFTDAMCGFKFFKRDFALKLLEDIPRIPDWFVAAELLVRSEWAGASIRELAVEWNDDPNSKARIGRLSRQYIGHIWRLRREKGLG